MAKINEKRTNEIAVLVNNLVYGVKNEKTGEVAPFEMNYADLKDSHEMKLFSDLRVKAEKEKEAQSRQPKKEFNRLASVIFATAKLSTEPTPINTIMEIANKEYVRINKTGDNLQESKWYGMKYISALEFFGEVIIDRANKTIKRVPEVQANA